MFHGETQRLLLRPNIVCRVVFLTGISGFPLYETTRRLRALVV